MDTRGINYDQPIALFPLPNCLLLPHAVVPLHIFEERYRKMISDALAGNKMIAMAMFEGDAWKHDYSGTPPLRPTVCVGYIIRHQELGQGKYNILLQGVSRARIVEELPPHEYRRAMLEPLESDPTMEIDADQERKRLKTLLDDPLLNELESVTKLNNLFSQELPTTALVDLCMMVMCDGLEERYAALSEPDFFTRAMRVEHMLSRTRKSVAAANRFAPEDPSLN